MYSLFNKENKWNDSVNNDMSLLTMLDTYLFNDDTFINNLIYENYPNYKYKPCKNENCKSELYGLNYIYSRDKDLVLSIVEIFFPLRLFTPSHINNSKENEYFLFMTLYAIQNIRWYQNIENSKDRGYAKAKDKIIKALNTLKEFGYSTSIPNTIDFPDHQNETISYLKNIFEKSNKIQQGDKVINMLKRHFTITTITATKKQKAEKFYIDKAKQVKQIVQDNKNKFLRKELDSNYSCTNFSLKIARYELDKTINPFSKFKGLSQTHKA